MNRCVNLAYLSHFERAGDLNLDEQELENEHDRLPEAGRTTDLDNTE